MLHDYLIDIGREDIALKYSYLLHGDYEDYDDLTDNDVEYSDRYLHILYHLNNDSISTAVFNLAMLEISMYGVSKLYHELNGYEGVSIEFAASVLSSAQEMGTTHFDVMKAQFSALSVMLNAQTIEHVPFFRRPLRADERILGYLCGSDTPDEALSGKANMFFGGEEREVYVGKRYVDSIYTYLEDFTAPRSILQIAGVRGVGKKLLLKVASERRELATLFADWNSIINSKEYKKLITKVKRECLLYGTAVCIHSVDEDNLSGEHIRDVDPQRILLDLLTDFHRTGIKTVVMTAPAIRISPLFNGQVMRIDIGRYTRAERIVFWEKFCELHGIKDDVDCVYQGSNFSLTPMEIEKAVQSLAYQKALGRPIDKKLCSDMCYDSIELPTNANIKEVDTLYTLDDIKLLDESKRQLTNLCNHTVYKHTVYDEWNMESRFAYGKNISALFSGPPGTGKTMAAQIIGNLTNMRIYKVDLSQVVDKYIGETEKKLEAIFSAAEKSNVILFFDEADAIFGKRSEVKEAKDRYANTEVSYILQRIEEYDGVVILATNYQKNIDEAFMRRIRYHIEFNLPTADIRKEIWQGAIPPELPTTDIDYDYLSRRFELSGGHIKNIILNAVFLAAGDNVPFGMIHILTSMRMESAKMGKVMMLQDFGEYAYLLY